MSETRTRRRIRQAVEARGFRVARLDWEPIYNGGEMCGWCGGWTLITDPPHMPPNTIPGDDLYGLSVDELLAEIDYSVKPPAPCDCDRTHHPMLAAGVINDPEKPTHGPECRWHIPYRLRWWKSETTEAAPSGEQRKQCGFEWVGCYALGKSYRCKLPVGHGGGHDGELIEPAGEQRKEGQR
ncbi:MAG TPA: hypothetical protein VFH56_09265 [Acidimicrobiales bacterium]|nr:hypothetical protein [Acidimicrobiales bacterium]